MLGKYLMEIKCFKSIFARKRNELLWKRQGIAKVNLPEPTWRNTPVFLNMICESFFPIPRSHFGHFLPFLSWLDNTSGTLHLAYDPLLQPKPSFSRCKGQMVIECMFAGWVNKAARLRIRSTSSFGPEKPRLAVWFDISLEQASKGIICVSFFLSRVSNPQIPPTRDLKEQHTSIFKQRHAPQISVFSSFTKPVTNWRFQFLDESIRSKLKANKTDRCLKMRTALPNLTCFKT